MKDETKDESDAFHLLKEQKHGEADEGFWNDWDNEMFEYLDDDMINDLHENNFFAIDLDQINNKSS